MKHFLLCLLIIVFVIPGKSQNLIPNGDFENFTSCPTDVSQIDSVPPWFSPSNATPDYLNVCGNYALIDLPNHTWGYQNPRSGNGAAGIMLFAPQDLPEYREYLAVPLLTPLVANTCYKLEYYLSLPNRCRYNSHVNAYFTDTNIHYSTDSVLPLTPQFNNNGGSFADTANWTLFSYVFTATGGENYLILGNFVNDQNIDTTMNPGGQPHIAYMFIDDVSLSVCTSVNEYETNDFIIYPNPTTDFITANFKRTNKNRKIMIIDSMGRNVFHSSTDELSLEINIRHLASGIYNIVVMEPDGVHHQSFKKQ